MSSKRGLSNEEKRKRMLEWFHEKQEFFQLKDVEKSCSTEKGITQQSIKDVLTSLVDDGLVESEKIGTSVYFWSLPSKALKKRHDQVTQNDEDLKAEKEKNARLTATLEKTRAEGSEDNEARRDELESEIEKLVVEKKKLQRELDAYRENDPDVYEKMRKDAEMAKKAANRWIENIFLLKSWLKNKFRVDESVIDKQFGISTDLDYIS